MKNRNVILTAVVMICALGSAVASKLFVVNPIHVSGTTVAGLATCSTIAVTCSNTGTRNCEVKIQLSTGVIKSTNGYAVDNNCIAPLKQQAATATFVNTNLQNVATYF